MAGIGFFVQGGSSWEAVSMADRLIAEIILEKTNAL